MDALVPYVESARQKHRKRKLDRIFHNLSYINRNRATKTFKAGDVVLIQDVRLIANKVGRSTYRPAIILDITKSNSCALVQALGSNRVLKYHFTYIKPLTKPLFLKLPSNWQNEILEATQVDFEDSTGQDMEFDSPDYSQDGLASQEGSQGEIL